MRIKLMLITVSALVGIAAAVASAQVKKTNIYDFTGVTHGDGSQPSGSLIFDNSGNLYGTTQDGGSGEGVAFELSPNGRGGWNESVLHAFSMKTGDGDAPTGALVFDNAGNLYGTTALGGP